MHAAGDAMATRQTCGGFQDGRRYHEPAADYPLSRGVELPSTGPIRAETQVRLNRIMYGHETIEGLEVENVRAAPPLHLVRENPGMHYERALKR